MPYVVAYVVLADGPKVFSMINDFESSRESIEVGTEVELVVGKIRNDEQGNDIISFKFKPVRGKA